MKYIGTRGSSRFAPVPEYRDPGNHSKLSRDTSFAPRFPHKPLKVLKIPVFCSLNLPRQDKKSGDRLPALNFPLKNVHNNCRGPEIYKIMALFLNDFFKLCMNQLICFIYRVNS